LLSLQGEFTAGFIISRFAKPKSCHNNFKLAYPMALVVIIDFSQAIAFFAVGGLSET